MPLDSRRLLDAFLDLVRIPSPSFHEAGVFEWLAGRLRTLGCEVETVPWGAGANLHAALPATDPARETVLLSAHADTVRPCDEVRPRVEAGVVRTDGTSVLGGDDKCALAEIVEALAVLREDGLPHGRIEILVTSAEEVGLVGAKHADLARITARRGLVLDASGEVGTAVVGAPYQDSFTVAVTGRKAHAGIEPEKGISAIVAAADLVRRFPTGRLDSVSVANFGTVAGGEADNIVAGQAVLTGEIRSHDPRRLARHAARLARAVARTARASGAVLELDYRREYDAFRVPDESPLLAEVAAACRAVGAPFAAKVAGGGSDANILSAKGIACVNLACGMRAVHTNEEHVRVGDLELTTRLLVAFLSPPAARPAAG